jgi:hypothetical protein
MIGVTQGILTPVQEPIDCNAHYGRLRSSEAENTISSPGSPRILKPSARAIGGLDNVTIIDRSIPENSLVQPVRRIQLLESNRSPLSPASIECWRRARRSTSSLRICDNLLFLRRDCSTSKGLSSYVVFTIQKSRFPC